MKSNAELQRDVIAELTYEPAIDPGEIGVIAKNGIVTLTGTVRNYAEKLEAAEAAERVQGVRAVIDEMHVSLPCMQHRADEDLAQAVLNTLKWDTRVPDENIKFKVNHGWVTLTGSVDYKHQQALTEDTIRNLTGVRGITNLIEVKPRVVASDIKCRIEEALRRSAQISEQPMTVEVEGSKVILRGTVHSRAEHHEAHRIAWSAPGVSEVEDHLTVAHSLVASKVSTAFASDDGT